MNYKANCTYCIAQMYNLYPNREKNPIKSYLGKTSIEVETKLEQAYIELINTSMQNAIEAYQFIEDYINNK